MNFNHLFWLLLSLPTCPVLGQNRPAGGGGTIGVIPGTGVATAAGQPDVAVVPSRGVAVAGKLPAGTGLRAMYYAGAPRGQQLTVASSQA